MRLGQWLLNRFLGLDYDFAGKDCDILVLGYDLLVNFLSRDYEL